MPPWSKLLERPRPGLILISRCKTLASARGFRGSVSCSFIPSCLAGDSGGGFCESRVPAALGGTSERRPHPPRPFRIPGPRSSSASSSPLGGLQFLAHVATTNGASGCSVLFLYCYDLRTAVPFFTSRAFIVSAAKERLGLRAVTALVTWSPPPYFWEGEGRGCQGTSCLLSLLPFRLLPLVLPRLPVAVRRRRDWRRGGRNYRREWRTAAINPRRQVFRG